MSKHPKIWFLKRRPAARARLFGIAYAGASARIYHAWTERLPSAIEVCPVELPGRGLRMSEPLLHSIDALVDDVMRAMSDLLDRPFFIFGHSLGAIVGFEVTRYLRRVHAIAPEKLFVSGRVAPHVEAAEATIHHLPDPEFLSEVRSLNGIPDTVWEQKELMSLVLPVLRADFAASETYRCRPDHPLHCPIVAFGGVLDGRVHRSALEAWGEHTRGEFRMRLFDGDHFFLHDQTDLVLRSLRDELER